MLGRVTLLALMPSLLVLATCVRTKTSASKEAPILKQRPVVVPCAENGLTIATYNVENFWDDVPNNTKETYAEFNETISNWYKGKFYLVKAENIANAVAIAGSPDIVAFQEFENGNNSGKAMTFLAPLLEKQGYKYFEVGKQSPETSVTTAVASKCEILSKQESLSPPPGKKELGFRDPQVVTLKVKGVIVRLYNSHWKSKRKSGNSDGGEMRLETAALIKADILKFRSQNPEAEVISLGDFNSTQDEAPLLDGASSGNYKNKLTAEPLAPFMHDLWFELDPQKRCSYFYKEAFECIDHILVSGAAFDRKGYDLATKDAVRIVGRHGTDKREQALLLPDSSGKPMRWQSKKDYSQPYQPGVFNDPESVTHFGKGYSDHLPLVAKFECVSAPCK
jgi:endonuclease/exonuclease/phosphatase family metal-dependent hydrolase